MNDIMIEASMTLKQRKQYRELLKKQEEHDEIEARQYLRRVHRSSSDRLYYTAMANHARRYRQFYTEEDVYKYERAIRMCDDFYPSEFILWSSCD